eukprot:6475541-Amphidinium_carterae.2
MPSQELATLLGEMKWSPLVIIEGSRRMHRGTASWLAKSTSPPPLTSIRLSHSESHQICAISIEANQKKPDPKPVKSPPWMGWNQRLKQPLAPPPTELWRRESDSETPDVVAARASSRSRGNRVAFQPLVRDTAGTEGDDAAMDDSLDTEPLAWTFEVEQPTDAGAQQPKEEPAGKKARREPTKMEKLETQLDDLHLKFERMMQGLQIIHQKVEMQTQVTGVPSAGEAPMRPDEVM